VDTLLKQMEKAGLKLGCCAVLSCFDKFLFGHVKHVSHRIHKNSEFHEFLSCLDHFRSKPCRNWLCRRAGEAPWRARAKSTRGLPSKKSCGMLRLQRYFSVREFKCVCIQRKLQSSQKKRSCQKGSVSIS